ncbi:MAG: EFR1 family ferrodoxin [Candidatus Aegiribacteria sp.]
MGTEIYWFSGSGNSLHVAKRIGEAVEGAELIPVAEATGEVEELPRQLGLVFPVYAWGPPALVAEFIENLPAGSPDYVFAVATCGSSPGSTMSITGRKLEKRGIVLDASMTLRMVENYPPMGGAPGSEKQAAVLEAAEKELDAIVEKVAEGWRGSCGRNNLFFSLLGRVVHPLFSRNVSKQAGRFRADDRCTSCGLCVQVCPVRNIELDDEGRPIWGNRCQQCFACFHWCPEEAVQFGRRTEKQPRYHHPEVSLKDMLIRDEPDRQADR